MCKVTAQLACLLLLFVSTGAQSLTVHYDPTRNSMLRDCDRHSYVGDSELASECYRKLLGSGSLLVQADAAMSLGEVQTANRLFREASADDGGPEIKTRWGYLYLATHQVSDAVALFREALVADSTYLPARIGLAEALAESYEGQAHEDLQRITAEHPDNIHALLLQARIELELQNINPARVLLDRALMLADEQQITALEIYALHAGANLLDGKSMAEWSNRALALNPSYGDVYAIPAHFYIITYRYREAVELYQLAVNTDPTLALAHRNLGINLLRIDNVFGARYHMQKAFELDPFDIETVNTLRLLDKLDGMRITQIDVADPDDATNILGRVIIRLDREDADSLEPYVIDLTVRAVQTFTKRYQFRLKKPMIVELYHDHDDFGVRTVSTPGIGLLGVTFGYLLAMDSPKARVAGEFHWGSTLWHEIAHVFTLEATQHRLPRWFSEGLSVYEEWNTGPLPDRELPLDALDAIHNQRLLPIEELDSGFVRPDYPGQVQVSYMQAGLICDFIAQRFGHDALVTLLKAFAAGQTTRAALLHAIQLDGPAFDQIFGAYLNSQYGDLTHAIDDYRIADRQLGRAVDAEDWISVEALARDLIRRYPQRVGEGNPYEWLAQAQREQGGDQDALETLLSWHRLGGHQPGTLQAMASDLRDADQTVDAALVMESLNWVMPYVVDEHDWLGNHYLNDDRPDLAIREFDALLGLRPEDPAAAYLGKARAALQMNDAEAARRQLLYALESAPFYRPAQHLLLELTSGEHVD